MDSILQVQDLHKSYGAVQAVRGIDFTVERGALFAFLGPNGAGKSTTINIICTFLQPDRGAVLVDGYQLGREDWEIRKRIGAVFQEGVLDKLLTVEENLRVRGGFYGLRGRALGQAVERASEAAGVADLLKRPYGKLSGGQRRRCDIARALIHTPRILFLDEPTTGLDPQTRRSVWDTIDRLRRERDMTIFLTTHYMEEAGSADDVVVLDAGRIAAQGTPSQLKERYSRDRLLLTTQAPRPLSAQLEGMGLAYRAVADTLEVPLPDTLSALPVLEACKGLISSFEVVKGTMDDAFIAITGKEIRE